MVTPSWCWKRIAGSSSSYIGSLWTLGFRTESQLIEQSHHYHDEYERRHPEVGVFSLRQGNRFLVRLGGERGREADSHQSFSCDETRSREQTHPFDLLAALFGRLAALENAADDQG